MRRPDLTTFFQLPHMIRFRLTLWYTGLAAVLLATFVGSVFVIFSHYQVGNMDDQERQLLTDTFNLQVALVSNCPVHSGLNRQQMELLCLAVRTPHVQDPNALNKSDQYIQYYTADGKPLPGKNGQPTHTQQPLTSNAAKTAVHAVTHSKGTATLYSDSGNYHYVTISFLTEYGQKVIGQIAAPVSKVQQALDELMRILIAVAAILLLTSAVGGWFLAGRALRPIDEITKRARQITVQDLSQRLNLDQEDELGRMAATFDDMIGRLEEAFERHKRFTSDASHELRTPLTVMQADIGLALTRPRSAEEYRQTLVSMDEEVGRLSLIVNDLLMLTRIDVDPAGMQHSPVPLHELLAGLARRLRVIAAERDITVFADQLDAVTVIGDATRLRQLFTNLLDNAVTYTRPGGSVTLTLHRTREGARVQVCDTGIGIEAEHLPRIFERFYRTGAAREENAHGTGLGLAISRSVVQAHHGEIGVQSTPSQGTTFTVTLPTDGRKGIRRIYGLRALVPGAATAR